MQILMSKSLQDRVTPEEPISEKLLANFILHDTNEEITLPLLSVEWKGSDVKSVSVGVTNVQFLKKIIDCEKSVDISVEGLNIYQENIIEGTYNLKEHHDYSYELWLDLEADEE